MSDAAREGIRREDHVGHPGRDKARIGSWKPGPAEHDVALRLVGDDVELSHGRRETCLGHLALFSSATGAPGGERLRRGVEYLPCFDPTGDHEDRAVRTDRAAVMIPKIVRGRGAHDGEITDGTSAEGMSLRIDELAPGTLGHRACVLRVLFDLGNGLLADELDL